MRYRFIILLIVIIVLLLSGCQEINDMPNENSDNTTNNNNNDLSILTIEELMRREKLNDYTYFVESVTCSTVDNCEDPTNMTVKQSNKLNYTLQIIPREGYTSYYLYDFNDNVLRHWSPGFTFEGSAVECYGTSLDDYNPKTLIELNATIQGREKFYYGGEYIDSTYVVYNTYQESSPEEIKLVYEQWIWDEYGVKLKVHIYRPHDVHLPDYDYTQTMTNYVFGDLSNTDFLWPDPCDVVEE